VLGTVLEFPYLGERIGVPARVGAVPLDPAAGVNVRGVPIVAIAGTCMDAGKTVAACAAISRFRHNALTINAFKATGVALRRDILAMEDAGARRTGIFTDHGILATTPKNAPALARMLLTRMAEDRPHVVTFELGDGLLGAYGVEAILKDSAVRDALSAVVLCANDPVGAWGGIRLLREDFDIEPVVVTGPATDNQVGIDIIEQRSQVRAINALTNGAALGDLLLEKLGMLDAAAAQA